MSDGMWAIAGIAVTLIVGLPAFFVAKTVKSKRQSQTVGANGTAYQAGRDNYVNKRT